MMKELEVLKRRSGPKKPVLLLMGAQKVDDKVVADMYCVISDVRKGTVLKSESGKLLRVNTSFKPTFSSVQRIELTDVTSGSPQTIPRRD